MKLTETWVVTCPARTIMAHPSKGAMVDFGDPDWYRPYVAITLPDGQEVAFLGILLEDTTSVRVRFTRRFWSSKIRIAQVIPHHEMETCHHRLPLV